MGTLRSVVSAVETILVAQGYSRAGVNFTLENAPASIGHKTYTFAGARIQPSYHTSNRADYATSTLGLLILWQARGSHNSTGTYQESYLDLFDAYEALETAVVKNQLLANDENNLFGAATITPLVNNEQEWLVLTIDLYLDVERAM